MRPRIYISGPLTSSGNVLENLDRAMEAARQLIAAGFAPFCPHLTYHVDPGEQIPHGTWLDCELPWVEVADAVLRLPGESVGADIEVERAETVGVPVFRSLRALVRTFGREPATTCIQTQSTGLDGSEHPPGPLQIQTARP